MKEREKNLAIHNEIESLSFASKAKNIHPGFTVPLLHFFIFPYVLYKVILK